ncbi:MULTISPECIES: phage tail protein [unclassified Ochrobactrum]|uniref:phage tail-collar fiber domain-containing protein n=1 Tax=unclassified Ochrobactrum TaxID=239106 RepID=UPI000DEF7647|nr:MULTISPECIES: phage tail protein [unclassified Ochrobactrum]MBQ0707726.1 phage tail protein [Ochrobactrum sp. AP1BH01-1]
MAQNTFALMTNLGRAKEAAALANGTSVVITHIAIGDGTTVPSGGETALYHEVARKAISGHGTVVGASNVAYFDIFLEAAEGPYTIREAGLIDQDGDLIAIARYDPPISKPIPSSGQTVEGTIRLEVAFSNISAITIVVDPAFKVAMQRLNRLPWLPVIAMTQPTPPATPAIGDVYLVPDGATGAWAGQAGKIAEYTAAGWGLASPADGHGISLPDGRIFERIAGTYIEKVAIDAQSGKWNSAPASGTANALTAVLAPAISSYKNGLLARLAIQVTNTGPATLDAGAGAKPIVRFGGSPLKKGDLPAGSVADFIFNAASNAWQLVTIPSAIGGVAAYATAGTYTFVVPAGVYNIKRVRVWGAGGGGGGCSSTTQTGAGGGGGSGAYGEKIDIPVTPGASIIVTVGAGGAPGPAGNTGGNGGTSSFGTYLAVLGGGGAGGSYGGMGPFGAGANTPTNADVGIAGNNGTEGVQAGGTYFAGVGAGAPLGSGGTSQRILTTGRPGLFPGGGGGGAAGSTAIGGEGAPGFIIVEY